jgi:hypothetical protein
MAGGIYPASSVPFPAGSPAAVEAEIGTRLHRVLTLLTAELIAKVQADGSGPIHRYRFVVL